jgi:choline dehydrogenase-like flavoprotein
MQIINPGEVHDVVIIGSGACGGMAAWNLTRQGVKVLMLDAGKKFNRANFWTHVKPWEWNQRLAEGRRPPQFLLDIKEQPYALEAGQFFDLWRVWGRGGRPTSGVECRFGMATWISKDRIETGGRSPGRSAIETSLPTMTRSIN